MPYADFVHLRTHSSYSLSEGALHPKELVEQCRRERMPAIAVTDTGNLFGAMEFSSAAKEAGVQPIIGCQVSIEREDGARGSDQLVLLVQNEAGYEHLLHLINRSFGERDDGHFHLSWLEGHSAGLIALSGGPGGAMGRLIGSGQDARPLLDRLTAIFPGRFYIELQRHYLAEEARIEATLLELAYATGIPLVATNDVYFGDEAMHEAQDVLLCIAEGRHVAEQERRRLTRDHRFKSAAEMRALFADIPEACDNTLVVAQRCAFVPPARKPILPAFASQAGMDEASLLEKEARAGLERRFEELNIMGERQHAYRERLGYELGVIAQMGFPGYFLIVADFITWAKRQGIPVGPGRGSGVGSVVAWALTITNLDPLRWGLLFERFLNPERISMPDFDVDFCQERRDEVIRYVRERYGSDRVAQIITFGKLQARAALRDAGRVLQVPYGQVDRLSKLVPSNPTNPVTLKKAIANEPLLAQAAAQDGTVRRMLDIAQQIEGLYRNVSTHAAGIVIGDRPLEDLVPLYKDPRSSMPATQFNMKDVEKAGLVKFDFLGLKTLSVLKRAQTLLARRGIAVDLDHLPLNDEKTFAMLSQGSATGVFQMEGSGMRDMLRRLKPDRFEDLIAVVALYRPGPMDNIPRYIGCKHGLEEHDYLDPSLEPILKETFGIMVYQEQVMQIAQVLAGYSLGSADLLRRAMGKKIKEEMEAQRKDFISGAMRNGVSAERAERIFEQVEKFAGYGFNKSHAAAYALIAYQTAWLKANYPVEFFAASMAYDMGNTDKLSIFRQALNELDIQVLPPDINASDVDFSVEALADGSLAVRYALAAVKNVGHGPVSAIVAERQANGAYASLADFCNRIDPRGLNKRQLEALIAAGAFDSLNKNRRLLFEGADHILRHAHAAFAAKTSQQSTLFGAESRASDLALPTVPDWPPIERLQQEYGAVGFYLSAHPLDAYRSGLRRLDIVPFANLADYLRARSTSRARLAGIVTSRQERISAKGNRFAFVQMTDLTGQFEVTVFTDRLTQYRDLLEIGKAVIVTAEIRQEEQDMRLIADRIESLDQAVQDSDTGLLIRLRSEEALSPVKTAIDRAGRGKGKIALSVELDELNQTVRLQLPGKWAVTPALTSELSGIPGVGGLTEI